MTTWSAAGPWRPARCSWDAPLRMAREVLPGTLPATCARVRFRARW
ncbi:hypothetical protein ACH3VS_30335 [Streptomyces sp. WSLK1-3]